MAGHSILKHMHNLSDEDLCARWIENPYYLLFCGEEFFQHQLTFDRSSLTRWRQRMGEDRLAALIQESLAVATRTGAAKYADFSKVIVDTTPRRSPFRLTPGSCIGRASGWRSWPGSSASSCAGPTSGSANMR
jgi:transposase-like protein DUF772